MHVPGVRWMARRRAAQLFDLCAGFVYAQVLTACVQADLFNRVRSKPCSDVELAESLSMPLDGLQRLLGAATALGLLRRRRDALFGLGPLGAAVVADPGIAAMVSHHHMLYADLADPLTFLRCAAPHGSLSGFWPYGQEAHLPLEGEARAYTTLMAASQNMVAQQVLATVAFGRHSGLLDLGGGDGTFLRAVKARHNHLRLALLDLPAVTTQARRAFTEAGVVADIVDGDLHDAVLPRDTDLVSLVRVLHDHDDASVRTILANIGAQLAADATLLIAEPMADVRGAERVGNVYFPFYLKAMGRGRTRSAAEYIQLLRESGFGRIKTPATSLPIVASVILARKRA